MKHDRIPTKKQHPHFSMSTANGEIQKTTSEQGMLQILFWYQLSQMKRFPKEREVKEESRV
jgi:hypothetical protein